MATRNTPTTSTLEEWRVEFNELATDVGNVTGSSQGDQLTTSATDIVGAINELETNFNAFVGSTETAADNITTGDGAVNITTSSGNITIDAAANNTDIIFKGTDATADITMLTLDGSEAGAATFNSAITGGGLLTTGGNIVIPDAGNIGSASDTNAIAIGSDGDVTLTQDLELQHDGAILSFGANDEVTLTHVHDTGILLNSTNVIQFNDASQNIGAPSATVLDINATDEIELNATLADINANLDVSGTYTGGGLMTTGGNIVIPDAGNIGSASDTNAITISSGGVVAVTATTASTNSTTGALTVGGGAGVAADLSVGDDLRLISDAAVLSFGADSDVTLTHVADTGILLNSTMAIQFNDASQSINAPSNAILDINATDEIELNATLVDVNANLDVSGTVTSGGVVTGTGFTIGSAAINETELEIIDGATVTTTELNLLDGGTSVGSSITLADADGFIVNDAGTMKTIPASDILTYAKGTLVFLAENDVTGGVHASTAFTSTHITSAYERYLITFQDVDFNNDNITFYAQISTDNGSNYKTSDYRTAGLYVEHNGSATNDSTLSSQSYIMTATNVANQATHTLNGHMWLINPSNSATYPQAYSEMGYYAEDDYARRVTMHGVYSNAGGGGGATAFNNIKFAPSASVFNEGKFVLYGVKNS